MAYLQHYESRYGDYYEIHTDDVTGEFVAALRSVGGDMSSEKIYYSNLSDIPAPARDQIEHLVWKRHHPQSSSPES